MKISNLKFPRIKIKIEFISTWHLYWGMNPMNGRKALYLWNHREHKKVCRLI